MAAKSTVKDVFANRAFKQVTCSAANTLTFEQIQFGVGLFQGVALKLSRIEYFLPLATAIQLIANTDEIQVGVTNRDDLASLDPTNQSVLVHKRIQTIVSGTAASAYLREGPIVTDLSTMPGGGLIIPANPIYVGVVTAGYSIAAICQFILYFTFMQLSDSEYMELLQTIMPANI